MNLVDKLSKLNFYFHRGEKVYSEYQKNGCIYLYARILRENNASIVELLISIYSYLPDALQKDAFDLVHHIDVWTALWDCLEKEINPKANDKFVFQNSVNYPKTAESNLLKFYESLR